MHFYGVQDVSKPQWRAVAPAAHATPSLTLQGTLSNDSLGKQDHTATVEVTHTNLSYMRTAEFRTRLDAQGAYAR